MWALHKDEFLAISRYTQVLQVWLFLQVVLHRVISKHAQRVNWRETKRWKAIYTLLLPPAPFPLCWLFCSVSLPCIISSLQAVETPSLPVRGLVQSHRIWLSQMHSGAFLILLLPPVYIPAHFSFSMGKKEILAGITRGPLNISWFLLANGTLKLCFTEVLTQCTFNSSISFIEVLL